MIKLKRQIGGVALGATSGLAGLVVLSRCSGHCSLCYGCIGVGVSFAILALARRSLDRRARAGEDRTSGTCEPS